MIRADIDTQPVPVVLLQPPGACSTFTRSGSLYPPLGLLHLAATVDRDDCVVVDADGLKLTDDQAIEAVIRRAPRLVGMTATSYTLEFIERFASRLAASGIDVIVGGPAASLSPAETFARCPSARYVFRGEGEQIFPDIVARARLWRALDDLPGVHARDLDTSGACVGIQQVRDLNAVPLPVPSGLPIDAYWAPDARRQPMMTVCTTRGCPHRCAFCSSPKLLGKKVRGWTPDRVVDYLDELTQLGVREISFVDDVFTINRRRCLAICRGMVERGLDLTWYCNARADQVDPELATAMSDAGCHQVYLGFESGSQAILDRVRKGIRVDQLLRGAEILAEARIDRSVGFVIGLPGETDETVQASIELAQQVRPERLQFSRFTPLVGAALADFTSESSGFHSRHEDQVGQWVKRCYAACSGFGWAQRSC